MRALVTGASGFVGRHLVDALRREGAEAFGFGGPLDGDLGIDLGDAETIRRALDLSRPDVVFHLAAQTFVPDALASPIDTYEINAIGSARLAEAVRAYDAAPLRVVFASSAEVYGVRAAREYPLRETVEPRPQNPYGASKAAAETILLGESRAFGLDVVVARAFNTIGPGQSERFVIASFAAQLARIAAGGDPKLFVGNLDTARDFLDVRDVTAAYVALARDGERGEIYNVCSGAAISIRDALGELIRTAGVAVEVREDPQRVRAAENPLSAGDPAKVRARTGWVPQIPLRTSLRDVYAAARDRVAAGAAP
ncbi:MAG TPA: GDP-mannose 4,6-dehydratase [Candidatus Cybelea sp.]|jgi:GDP-4-dehydro-6-deoxy-D-mannose reductase|nr:GDP-mannose 4,6-dehydratase [Candidatus Cybelea sp.]